MQALFTLTRRELATYFVSFTGYVIMAAATFLIGLSFVVLVRNLGSEPSPMPVTEMFYSTFFIWLLLLLAAPVITMRLFALAFLARQVPASSELPSQVLNYFALFQQMNDFARGVVDTRPIMVYASLSGLFLFLTLRAVESRRWR